MCGRAAQNNKLEENHGNPLFFMAKWQKVFNVKILKRNCEWRQKLIQNKWNSYREHAEHTFIIVYCVACSMVFRKRFNKQNTLFLLNTYLCMWIIWFCCSIVIEVISANISVCVAIYRAVVSSLFASIQDVQYQTIPFWIWQEQKRRKACITKGGMGSNMSIHSAARGKTLFGTTINNKLY